MKALTRLLVAISAAAALSLPSAAAAADPCATLRVETLERTVIGSSAPSVCSTRSYLDTDGTAHVLPASTALGQLVSATGWQGLELDVTSSDFGGFVSAIAGISGGETGYWALFVGNEYAQVGADTATTATGDEVVWILDPDFSTPGPEFLDLDLVRARNGIVSVLVTRVGEEGAQPAVGATVTVNGRRATTGDRGLATVRIRRGRPFVARATQSGLIRSERITGRA